MKKNDKLKLLDELVSRMNGIKYSKNSPQLVVIDDTISFVQNTMNKAVADKWVQRIEKIHWSLSVFTTGTPDSSFARAWENGKVEFLGVLSSIRREIELYEHDGDNETEQPPDNKQPVIFISHSSADNKYGNALEKFITGLGVKNEQLIYTSHPLHKIPLDENIYDYLRNNIYREMYMIFLWSDEYLESPACMNEMGAAWVTQSDYTNIYVSGFSLGNPKYHQCAVDTKKMGAVLNGDAHCKANMIEMKDKILKIFKLSCDEAGVQFLIDEFVKDILAEG
jgi:hypothetical protein